MIDRIKFFDDGSTEELETVVNAWIEIEMEHDPYFTIVSIVFQDPHPDSNIIVMVHFRYHRKYHKGDTKK